MKSSEPAPAPTEVPPRRLGFRMPAEWERHRATWLAWPHEASDWPGKFSSVPWVFAEVVRWLARGEAVEIVVQGARGQREARRTLERSDVPLERVRFHRWPTDRSWTRDSGPTFVLRDSPAARGARAGAVHWRFNAWAKYDNWSHDRELPRRVTELLRIPRWRPVARGEWVVLEGGAIDVNGRGSLLATRECLLRAPQARNPGLSRDDLERVFYDYLGVDHVIWLSRGIRGDDTHGHIDDVARFVAARAVAAVTTDDRRDPNFAILARNRTLLEEHRGRAGGRLRVLELPSPRPIRFDGTLLPASYANFYVANAAVLVPTFDDPADSEAIAVLRRAFPDRTVVGVRSRDLVWGLGTLHCSTQQEPGTPPSRAPA